MGVGEKEKTRLPREEEGRRGEQKYWEKRGVGGMNKISGKEGG